MSAPSYRSRFLFGLAVLVTGGLALSWPHPAAAEGEKALRVSPVVEAVERTREAVVSIHTTELVQTPRWYPWLPMLVEGKGRGSGVIFHPEGYVITNAHVVARASEILVDVHHKDGRKTTHEAHIAAVDIAHDLAIIRLQPSADERGSGPPFPYLDPGSSTDLMLGETVIALGNPYGIGLTVTTGVVSAVGRSLELGPERVRFDDFIQTDAGMNPGHSGGALLDVTGRWIGVNSAILTHTGGGEGIGFAIPVERVRALVARAFKRRLVSQDWLGIDLAPDAAAVPEVKYAFARGPAQKASVRAGDTITSVNGAATPTVYDFHWRLALVPVGTSVRLGVRHEGEERIVEVPLELLPTNELSDRLLGFVATDAEDEELRRLNLPLDAGVIVRQVRPEGPAARMRLQPGDLIVGYGGDRRFRHSDDLLIFLQFVQPGDLVELNVIRPMRGTSGQLYYDPRRVATGTLTAE